MTTTATRTGMNRAQCCDIAMAILAEARRNVGGAEFPVQRRALVHLDAAVLEVRDCNAGRMSGIACACALEWHIPGKLDIDSAPSLWHARDAIRACVSIMEVSQ